MNQLKIATMQADRTSTFNIQKSSICGSPLIVCLCLLLLLAPACSRIDDKPQAAAPSQAPQEKSTATLMIEGVTGKAAVDAGQRATATLEKAKATHNADAEEAGAY